MNFTSFTKKFMYCFVLLFAIMQCVAMVNDEPQETLTCTICNISQNETSIKRIEQCYICNECLRFYFIHFEIDCESPSSIPLFDVCDKYLWRLCSFCDRELKFNKVLRYNLNSNICQDCLGFRIMVDHEINYRR